MGYIKERMTKVFKERSLNPFAFGATGEIMPYLIAIDCTGTDTTVSYVLREKIRVIDAWALCTSSNGSGSVGLYNSDSDLMAGAIDMATGSAIARTSTVSISNQTEDKGNTIYAIKNAYTDKGWLFVMVVADKS